MIKKEDLNDFKQSCIAGETDVEAGYVNDPADLGGETNHGITIKVAEKYKYRLVNDFKWDGTMINLTQPMAYWLYDQEFWQPMRLDQICLEYSSQLAHTMFRWGLKSGSKRPVEYLQRILNVLNNQGKAFDNITADGLIGPKTMRAIDGLIKQRGHEDALTVLCWYLSTMQLWWMFNISEQRSGEINERFTWGWSVRCMREQFDYLKEKGIPSI